MQWREMLKLCRNYIKDSIRNSDSSKQIFHNHCHLTSRQTSDTNVTWLSLLFNLLMWAMACIMAWGTRCIYDRLFQIPITLVCPGVFSENIFSLDLIVFYLQYLTFCGTSLIGMGLGEFYISAIIWSAFLFGRHWAADLLLPPIDQLWALISFLLLYSRVGPPHVCAWS